MRRVLSFIIIMVAGVVAVNAGPLADAAHKIAQIEGVTVLDTSDKYTPQAGNISKSNVMEYSAEAMLSVAKVLGDIPQRYGYSNTDDQNLYIWMNDFGDGTGEMLMSVTYDGQLVVAYMAGDMADLQKSLKPY